MSGVLERHGLPEPLRSVARAVDAVLAHDLHAARAALGFLDENARSWHQIAWTCQAVVDHVDPRTDDPTRWTTACRTSNEAKGSIALHRLLRPVPWGCRRGDPGRTRDAPSASTGAASSG